MNLNQTPAAERPHIGFFGCRNAGKSSIVNAVTGQNLAVVSNVKGTTTDPVVKAMELLPAGPVVMIDTPGIDDDGELGKLRVEKSYQMLNRTDLAIVVIDGGTGIKKEDFALLKEIEKRKVPFIMKCHCLLNFFAHLQIHPLSFYFLLYFARCFISLLSTYFLFYYTLLST